MTIQPGVSNMRVQSLARIAEYCAFIGIILIFGSMFFMSYLLITNSAELDQFIKGNLLLDEGSVSLTPVTRAIALFIGFIPGLVGGYALFYAKKLFSGYRRGEIFTESAAKRLGHVGWAIVALAPVYTLCETLSVLAITMFNEAGKRQLKVSFDDTDVFAIVFGLLVVVVGRIMQEAAHIAQENKSFV